MNPIATKAAIPGLELPKGAGPGADVGVGQGTGKPPMDFDQLMAQIKTTAAGGAPAQAPSAPASVEPAMKVQPSPANELRQGLETSRRHITRLSKQIEGVRETPAAQGLGGRLTGIEQQYAQLNAMLQTMPANAGPQRWIVLQQQMYSMSENIGTLSKMVSQASSGMKSMLQTQV